MKSIISSVAILSSLLIGLTRAAQYDNYNNNNYHDHYYRAPIKMEMAANNEPPPRVQYNYRKSKCQTERFEHQVIMKRYNDSTGYWVLYTQIVETRNVGNRCHRNEYVYLAKKMRAGWLWNPKINSLVQYSLGEPKFITRKVQHPDRPYYNILVNMSRNYAPQSVDLDRLFPKTLARGLTKLGNDDLRWSDLARSSLPILQMDKAYFELVTPKENMGSQHLHILEERVQNIEVLE